MQEWSKAVPSSVKYSVGTWSQSPKMGNTSWSSLSWETSGTKVLISVPSIEKFLLGLKPKLPLNTSN